MPSGSAGTKTEIETQQQIIRTCVGAVQLLRETRDRTVKALVRLLQVDQNGSKWEGDQGGCWDSASVRASHQPAPYYCRISVDCRHHEQGKISMTWVRIGLALVNDTKFPECLE